MSVTINRLSDIIYIIRKTTDEVRLVTRNLNAQSAIQFQDEGANVGTRGAVSTIDFVGATVSLGIVGGKLTVTITSAGGGVTAVGNLTPLFTASIAGATMSFTQIMKAANLVFAGPSAGLDANPDFRALVFADIPSAARIETFAIACSDETTVLGTASTTIPKATFHMPYAFTITRVFAGLTTAGTGASQCIVDIHEAGTTIMNTTKILFSASTKLSADGTVSDTAIAANALIEIFLDQRDTDNVAAGLKVYIVGYQS